MLPRRRKRSGRRRLRSRLRTMRTGRMTRMRKTTLRMRRSMKRNLEKQARYEHGTCMGVFLTTNSYKLTSTTFVRFYGAKIVVKVALKNIICVVLQSRFSVENAGMCGPPRILSSSVKIFAIKIDF